MLDVVGTSTVARVRLVAVCGICVCVGLVLAGLALLVTSSAVSQQLFIAAIVLGNITLYTILLWGKPWPATPIWCIAMGHTWWTLCDAGLMFNHSVAVEVALNVAYLVGYLPMGYGFIRAGQLLAGGRSRLAAVDLLVTAVPVATIVLSASTLPAAAVNSQVTATGWLHLTQWGNFVFPYLDVVILAVLAKLFFSSVRHGQAIGALVLSMLCTTVADAIWQFESLNTENGPAFVVATAAYCASYILMLTSALFATTVANDSAAHTNQLRLVGRATVVLGVSLSIIPGTALVMMLTNVPVVWPVTAAGALLSVFVACWKIFHILGNATRSSWEFQEQALRDPLTNIANRRAWDSSVSRAVAGVDGPTGQYVSMLDLDFFKFYNDQYGHQQGDLLLREVTARWQSELPEGSLLARYGGEEFAVLLPASVRTDTDVRRIMLKCHRVVPDGQTCSIGVAQITAQSTAEEVLFRADAAMYHAKRNGRNQTVVWSEKILGATTLVRRPVTDES